MGAALSSMGVLAEIDLAAFGELCQNYAYYLITDRKILALSEQGVYAMQKTATGYVQPHPLLSLRKQYYEQWRRGLSDFGLTPATRIRLAVNDDSSRVSDPLERLLTEGWDPDVQTNTE